MINKKAVLVSTKLGTNYIGKNFFSSSYDTVLNGFMGTVGNTPLIKLEKFSKESGCDILVKCEYMNPGGSNSATYRKIAISFMIFSCF
jgi:cysteine synthase